MTDFDNARTKMVDCQIETTGVTHPRVLEAFRIIPREKFVPEPLQSIAYMDEDLSLGEGRYLMEPAVHARMVEALDLRSGDVVLDIGGVTGYPAAIMSLLVSTVIAVEEKKKYIDHAEKIWRSLDVCNVAAFKGPLHKGNPKSAPYDIIFLNGAVSSVPVHLVDQLTPGGKLIAIVKKPGAYMGEVVLVRKGEGEAYSCDRLFEASGHYLPGFEPEMAFQF